MYPYIITGNSVVVVVDNKQYTLSKDNLGFNKLIEAIKEGRWADVPALTSPVTAIKKFSNGLVDVSHGQVYYDGELLHSALANKIIDMFEQGFDIRPLTNFMKNLMDNPSKRAVDELYGFLEAGNMAITEDGHFLAYKKVRDDYMDVYSGTIDNSVGQFVTMPRNKVDENKDNTCSQGLHFCSFDYLKNFGGSRVMVLKINPASVVSIPSDYQQQKGRTCEYRVIGEVPVEEQQDRVLSKQAVDTRFSGSDRFSGSLENVFSKLSYEEKDLITEYTGTSSCYRDDLLDELLRWNTYREIREMLNRVLN